MAATSITNNTWTSRTKEVALLLLPCYVGEWTEIDPEFKSRDQASATLFVGAASESRYYLNTVRFGMRRMPGMQNVVGRLLLGVLLHVSGHRCNAQSLEVCCPRRAFCAIAHSVHIVFDASNHVCRSP